MSRPLTGQVALVTGASRGVGKGIAIVLGAAGATVYITARTVNSKDAALPGLPGSLEETVAEIESKGGIGIGIRCDHLKDEDIEAVFQQILRDHGRLDILVNNVFSGTSLMFEHYGKPFWAVPEALVAELNAIGVRSQYIGVIQAARIMVPQKSGLIIDMSVDTSRYRFSAAFGVGKTVLNKIAVDAALELEKHNVTCLNLWPAMVQTEISRLKVEETKRKILDAERDSLETLELGMNAAITNLILDGSLGYVGETAESVGHCVVALAQDPNLLKRSGKSFTTNEIIKSAER